jgi:hypothetical protein
MPSDRRLTEAILKTIARGDHRSPLFWWMVESHDAIIEAASGRRIHWRGFCAEASRLGLTDTRGKPPTERNARETWRQARLAVAKASQAERSAPTVRSPPSRISPNWRPALASPPQVTNPGSGAEAPYDAEAQMARLYRVIGERGGRKQQ